MDKICIAVTASPAPAAAEICAELAELFAPDEADLFTDREGLPRRYTRIPTEELARTGDVVVAVGGDGTIMHTARRAAAEGKPVAGVNAGRLGFLASLEREELRELRRLLNADYEVEERIMPLALYGGTGYPFVNDMVVEKAPGTGMVEISAGYRGQGVGYRGDGLIVATPTGSTAYSLSAGGPVLDPGLRCLTVTPICPHTFFSRSMVFDAERGLEVRLEGRGEVARVSFDGEEEFTLRGGEAVEVTLPEGAAARFIRFRDDAFYSVLARKIR